GFCGFAEFFERTGRDFQRGGGYVFFQVGDAGSSGDGQNHRRAPKQPGERELRGRDLQLGRSVLEGAGCAGEFSGGEREPGNEADVGALAVFEHVFGAAVGEAVAVLHGDHRNQFAGVVDLLDADLRKADVLDLALRLEILERGELIFGGNFGVDAVELVEVDAVETEASQAAVAGFAQVLGPAVFDPFVRAGPVESALGGDHQSRGIRVQGFRDDFFAHCRAVGIGGVDEVDAELDGAAKDLDALLAVGRLTPDAVAGDPHGAESEAVDA